ncbi:ComF family protein [Rheinheimera sp. 4Y26]|uniref:ComF family protein n=1 Tax=Rheinheimera sp. 4Y26 TaxID=2977811 RepID=UPI0021B0F81C|nr:phosphoribosyltransferase family protein [Rheinheimera sp. 4Y26]MCT6700982.1 phosphoribosyltransferase family protein [Rheinheimera sp. 4Y26]
MQQPEAQLCDYCNLALPRLSPELPPQNALLLPAVARGLKPRHFDALFSLSWYQNPWSHWITHWKFQQDLACGALLCQQLAAAAQSYQAPSDAAICFVPMSHNRYKERGFNQAEELARVLATSLKLPLMSVFASKAGVKHQVGLSRARRRANLRRQFSLQTQHKLPAHMLLVDDVITTGATVNQLCLLLKKHGVRTVDVWTLAVTSAKRQKRYSAAPSSSPDAESKALAK